MIAKENRPVSDEAAQIAFGGADDNSSSLLLTFDEILVESANYTAKSVGNIRLDKLGSVCVQKTEEVLNKQNAARKVAGMKSLHSFQTLQPIQAAILLESAFSIRDVTPGGTSADDGLGLLSFYQDEGDHTGIYRRSDLSLLDQLAGKLRPTGDRNWHKEVELALRRRVPKEPELVNPDELPLNDCWYNYRTGQRTPFGPERVTLSKFATRLPSVGPPVPEIVNQDGTVWNAWDWFCEVIPDEGTRTLVLQVIGMCLRPAVDWRVLVYFIGDGLNGKGTILELIRAIVGSHLVTSIPPSKFADQFSLSSAVGKRLNLVDEDDVGKFIENAAVLKQVISRDPILLDRKHKDPISVQLIMSTIASLNEFPKHKDKTEAMYDRQMFIEFPERFAGMKKNPAIKNDYVKRAEVREWFAYMALLELPAYTKLSEPESVAKAKAEFRADSDKVVAFWEEYGDGFERDFLPFEMLYQLFVAHEKRVNPKGSVEAMRVFTGRLKKLVDPGDWIVPVGGNGKDKELGIAQWIVGPEPALAEFDYLLDVGNWDWDPYGDNGIGGGTPWMKKKRKARGFVRRSAWEAHDAAGTTPYLARHP
ncbi:DNA primase family protein [Pseudarthrobacter cellobiosi]|uniref:DNA primase family protein n=1 Tax=Pseudarthrobacter cellobiosi TaxID=2953654 RepID=UPI00208FD6CA|nr:phage/plasmid primase, P4 family [Pseudarthrobacter sp. HLT1-5]MCO4253880.1 phage/plasmid primase, P4 family [Pseudarthrobacter sp. HLT1-5]